MTEQTKDIATQNNNIEVSETKTSTTIFLLPALGIDKNKLIHFGFKNAYYGDHKHDVHYDESVYLLFKTEEDIEILIKEIEDKNKVQEVYDIGEYTMVVVKFPDKYSKDFKLFKEGKFSKFSKSYINTYFPFKKPTEWDSKGKVIKEEYTLFYHIFNKTDWLKDWWTKRLGYEDMKEFELDELWNKPHDKEEVFRYKN